MKAISSRKVASPFCGKNMVLFNSKVAITVNPADLVIKVNYRTLFSDKSVIGKPICNGEKIYTYIRLLYVFSHIKQIGEGFYFLNVTLGRI